jgi:hypothetical protein
MAVKYDSEALDKAIGKIEGELNKSDATTEGTGEILKSLADVAKGAVELAQTSRKPKKPKKGELAKAAGEGDDKDEKEDKDKKKGDKDDDDDMPKWLHGVMHDDDGKAAGEMIHAPGRDETGIHSMTNAGGEHRQMGKSARIDGRDVEIVDMDPYLSKSLADQAVMLKSIQKQRKLSKGTMGYLVQADKRLKTMQRQLDALIHFSGTMAKAMGSILSQRETTLSLPTGSKFASMEKSAAVIQAQTRLDAEGATPFPNNKQNQELLSKAVMTNKISPAMATAIKRTERLPAGVVLN